MTPGRALRESPRARRAFADYVALGPDRSIAKLQSSYVQRVQSGGKAGVPTRHRSRLELWSQRFEWQARLQAIADQELAVVEDAERARARALLETGYALVHERVAVLKELAERLRRDLLDDDRLWLTDRKGIGAGEHFQVVKVRRFNAAAVEQFRGLLEDLAAETGGRPRTLRVDLEERARQLAERYGLDAREVVDEAVRIVRELGW